MNNNCRHLREAGAPIPCRSRPLGTRAEACSLRIHYSAGVPFYSFSSLTICKITIHLLLVCFWVKWYALISGRLHAKISFSICRCLLRVEIAGARAGRSQAAISLTGAGPRSKLVHQNPWETITNTIMKE